MCFRLQVTMLFQRRRNFRLLVAMMFALMTSSHAWQPLYRPRWMHRFTPEEPLRLRALPRDVTLHPGSSVSVKCRVRVASSALRGFHIGFYVSESIMRR